ITQQGFFASEFLKTVARAMVQISLYKSSHPAVMEAVNQARTLLSSAHSEKPFTLAIDQDKALADGEILCTVDRLPPVIRNTFTKFRIHSVTFNPETTAEEIGLFCELSALKQGQAAEILAQKGVSGIRIDETRYTKVGADTAPENAGTG